MEVTIPYNFYEPYLTNNNFSQKFDVRLKDISQRYNVQKLNLTKQEIIKEYFVEIFSWSVFDKTVLTKLNSYFINNITTILDPCCGNAFHTFLLKEFLGLDVRSIDIQDEPNSWDPIIETDGVKYLEEYPINKQVDIALLLSWVDYEELNMKLLDRFFGPIVVSLGNYEKLSPNYLKKINENYKLVERIILKMPWELDEKIEIYKKTNYIKNI